MEFNQLSESTQNSLIELVVSDPYGLKPETLFNNIKGSLPFNSVESLSAIYEVPVFVISKIENELKNFDRV